MKLARLGAPKANARMFPCFGNWPSTWWPVVGGLVSTLTGVRWTQPPMPPSLGKDHLFTYLSRNLENVSRTIFRTWLVIEGPMGCSALFSSSCQSKQVGSQGDPGTSHTASGPQENVSPPPTLCLTQLSLQEGLACTGHPHNCTTPQMAQSRCLPPGPHYPSLPPPSLARPSPLNLHCILPSASLNNTLIFTHG